MERKHIMSMDIARVWNGHYHIPKISIENSPREIGRGARLCGERMSLGLSHKK